MNPTRSRSPLIEAQAVSRIGKSMLGHHMHPATNPGLAEREIMFPSA